MPRSPLLTLALAAALAVVTPAAARSDEPAAAPPDSSAGPAAVRKASRVILPVLAYSPDTDLMFGGTVLQFFYLEDDGPDVRPSLLVPVFIRTSRSQTMAFLQGDLNWDRGRRRALISGSFLRFPDQFYGVGRDSRDEDEEDYTPQELGWGLAYEQRVWRDLRLGLGWRQTRYELREVLTGGLLDTGDYARPGRTTMSQPELTVSWDSRDNTWSPRRGVWLRGLLYFARPGLGSDHDVTGRQIDLRAYRAAGERSSWAVQVRADWVDGDAPFYVLPRLGGQDGLRGYTGGRYMDKALIYGRVEWRSGPRLWDRVGGALFAGLGDVAPRPGAFTTRASLYTVGGGVRVLLNRLEGVSLRADYGVGHGHSGFFLTLGEAF
jgi:hypothetical protein